MGRKLSSTMNSSNYQTGRTPRHALQPAGVCQLFVNLLQQQHLSFTFSWDSQELLPKSLQILAGGKNLQTKNFGNIISSLLKIPFVWDGYYILQMNMTRNLCVMKFGNLQVLQLLSDFGQLMVELPMCTKAINNQKINRRHSLHWELRH